MEAHKEQIDHYLSREGTGKDGKKAGLYGSGEEEYRRNMAAKNFRVFLSPQPDKANLEVLARTFVRKIELQTGYKLYWQAAEHYNTAHPHVHLLINGRDKNGRDVFFPRDMVKAFFRETARDICTSMLGNRSRSDMEAEREAVLTACRWTRADEALKPYIAAGSVYLDGIRKNKERYVTRLDYLRTLGLCAFKNGRYVLEDKWEETLKAQGRYNCYLEAGKAARFGGDISLYEGGEKTGVVTKIYRIDESSDNHAVLLEGIDGRAYFVPLFRKPQLKEGDFITIKGKADQKGRLTPDFERVSLAALYKTVREKGMSGNLARTIQKRYEETGAERDKQDRER
jgi:hypothetical protein